MVMIARIVSWAFLAIFLACKPAGAGSASKSITGYDADRAKHAMSILPVLNYVEADLTKVDIANQGSRYASDLLAMKFFPLIDCIDLPMQSADEAIKNMELEAAIGNVYVDKHRQLWRRSLKDGKVNEPLPCSVIGPRMASVGDINRVLDAPYKTQAARPEVLRAAQMVYLALRGNYIEEDIVSATMNAYIEANSSFYGIGSIKIRELQAIMMKYDQDLNPCVKSVGRFGVQKFQDFACQPIPGPKKVFSYAPKAEAGNITKFRAELAETLAAQHEAVMPYSEAKSSAAEALYETLSSTRPWGASGGRTGQIGAFLAGTGRSFNFNGFFKSDVYGDGGKTKAGFALAAGDGQGFALGPNQPSVRPGGSGGGLPARPNGGALRPENRGGGGPTIPGGGGQFGRQNQNQFNSQDRFGSQGQGSRPFPGGGFNSGGRPNNPLSGNNQITPGKPVVW